jgi:hypothetical protein
MSWCIKTCWVTGHIYFELWGNQHIVVDYFEHEGVYRMQENGGWLPMGLQEKVVVVVCCVVLQSPCAFLPL